jgi:putative ABC transport system permease protein
VASGGGNKIKYEIQIVGVVRDSLHNNMRSEIRPTMYQSFLQVPSDRGMYYYVRTRHTPEVAMGAIRHSVQQIDSKLVLDHLSTMEAQIDDNINTERMIALLAVSFGVLATLLAGIGLYGVLAYSPAQRTREIGVRMALGADRMKVVMLILRDMLKLAGISIAVAIPIALLLTRALKSELYRVSNTDPLVFVAVTLLVGAVAIFSAALPARRAASLEPSRALREE